jgi:uncharacterized protein YdhG (YjbR/CyaY superfamily)
MTLDEYIGTCSKDVQAILEKIRQIVREEAPDAVESINYGIPTFKLNGKNLVHFAAFAKHIGFYPTPSAIVAFEEDLTEYKFAKGSIQFPLDKPMPFDLVKKMVIFRVKEVGIKA